jgi:NCS1 family nucleobase:cation symporter-1
MISFRTGGLITGVIGIAMQPWKLMADPTGYIFTWLIGYSALLGPIGGILITDYFIVRKKALDVDDLYSETGRYRYSNGWNPAALVALALGILPNIPGFIMTVAPKTAASFPAAGFFMQVYNLAWFVGFGISGLVYYALTTMRGTDAMRDQKTAV